MEEETVDKVRRFNRAVTQRVGALNDSYLARGRPLGEARVLWEIGEHGCDVRELRTRLDLDSGYVSRLLRALEAAGLVIVGPSNDDKRLRSARLTRKGMAERVVLDQRSQVLARSLLDPLTDTQRERLVESMGVVERLLSAALVTIDAVDPASRAAQHCLDEYFAELDIRFDIGFDPAKSLVADLAQMRLPDGLFVVATLHGQPIGCGALVFHGSEPPHVKRMWVDASARGLGLGRRVLTELERRAAEHGHHTLRLETNRTLGEAISMYRSAGYREVAPFNDELYADHWFEKQLDVGAVASR
jgi:DNA-binding MarR family transcriptional regulator/GNAT superfamily N-acetyltransferase